MTMLQNDGSPERLPRDHQGNREADTASADDSPEVPERVPEDSLEPDPGEKSLEGVSEDGQDLLEYPIDLPSEPFFEEDSSSQNDIPEPDETLPENEENPDLEAQLTGSNGVSDGMGTIALDRAPFRGKQSAATAPLRTDDWSKLSDAEIMQRAGTGDDACLEYLVAKYRRPIVHFMFRMVRNQAVAEELAQEVFLRVYRSRQSYRAEARFSTWLYRIASNLAVNHARDTKYERSASSVYLDAVDAETGTSPDVADSTPSVEQDMLQKERMRQIRAQVLALPERQKMAVLMHKYQGLNYKDIGAVLKLSESATKSLLFRAYQTLRESLKAFV